MISDILTLLSVQRTAAFNNWKWANQRQRLIFGGAAAFGVLLVVGNLFFAFLIVNLPKLLSHINLNNANIQAVVGSLNLNGLVGQVLNFFFIGAFVFLLFDAMSSALPNLYQANDLALLLSSPLPTEAVFSAKLLFGLLRPYLLLFGFGLPYLVGVGLGLGYGAAYYLFIIFALLLLPLIPAGLGALLTAALVRRIPAYRLSEALEVIGGIIGLGLAGVIVVLGLQANSGQAAATSGLISASASANSFGWLPTSWAVAALQGAGTGDWTALIGWGLPYLLIEVGVFVVCAIIATRIFYAGWVGISISAKSHRQIALPTTPAQSAAQVLDTIRSHTGKALPPLGAILRAVLGKDAQELRREPTAIIQLLGPTLIGLVFVLQWRTSANLHDLDAGVQQQAFIVSCLWMLFLSSFSAGLFGLNSFSREQKSIWILKLAPVSANRLLLAKFALTYALLLVFGCSFSLLYGWVAGAATWQMIGFLFAIVVGGIGSAAISVGVGAIVPRLNAPTRIISLAASVVSLFLLMVYFMSLLTCVYSVYSFHLLLDPIFPHSPWPARLVGIFIGLLIVLFFTFVPLRLARRRLELLEL